MGQNLSSLNGTYNLKPDSGSDPNDSPSYLHESLRLQPKVGLSLNRTENPGLDWLKGTRPQAVPGGALPIMDYMGRLRPKGVPFSGWKYIKG